MSGLEKIVEDTAVELLRIAATELPIEYVEELDRMMNENSGAVGKSQLKNIIEDTYIARKDSLPMCRILVSSPSWLRWETSSH